MKKQYITKNDIRRDLLSKINKSRKLSIFLTIVAVVASIAYVLFILNYADIMAQYTNHRFTAGGFHPAFGLCMTPIILLLLVGFLLDFYYIDLFRIKKGMFSILEEPVCQRKEEYVSYYRRSEKENALYFRSGRVSVSNPIYSQADIGDSFFVIVLRAKKAPELVYPAKYYEIAEPTAAEKD